MAEFQNEVIKEEGHRKPTLSMCCVLNGSLVTDQNNVVTFNSRTVWPTEIIPY